MADGHPRGTTLESCLKAAHNVLKTVQDRTIIRDSGQHISAVKRLAPRDGGFFLHITADTPGERASVVPKVKKDAEELDVGTIAAPDNAEFMDGDAFLYVKGDHVCLCTTGLRDGAVRLFLYEFFDKAGLGDHATKFELMKAANVDKLKMLRTQGVKEIALNASLYQATASTRNGKALRADCCERSLNIFRRLCNQRSMSSTTACAFKSRSRRMAAFANIFRWAKSE
jgi:hypothetical protein